MGSARRSAQQAQEQAAEHLERMLQVLKKEWTKQTSEAESARGEAEKRPAVPTLAITTFTIGQSSSSNDAKFEQHLPLSVALTAVESGLHLRGHLRVNKLHAQPDNSVDRVVDATTGGVPGDAERAQAEKYPAGVYLRSLGRIRSLEMGVAPILSAHQATSSSEELFLAHFLSSPPGQPLKVERVTGLVIGVRKNGLIVLPPKYHVKSAVVLQNMQEFARVAHPLDLAFDQAADDHTDEGDGAGAMRPQVRLRLDLDEARQELACTPSSSLPAPLGVPRHIAASTAALPLSLTFRLFYSLLLGVSLRPNASRYRTPKPTFELVWQGKDQMDQGPGSGKGATQKAMNDRAGPELRLAAASSSSSAPKDAVLFSTGPPAPAGAKKAKADWRGQSSALYGLLGAFAEVVAAVSAGYSTPAVPPAPRLVGIEPNPGPPKPSAGKNQDTSKPKQSDPLLLTVKSTSDEVRALLQLWASSQHFTPAQSDDLLAIFADVSGADLLHDWLENLEDVVENHSALRVFLEERASSNCARCGETLKSKKCTACQKAGAFKKRDSLSKASSAAASDASDLSAGESDTEAATPKPAGRRLPPGSHHEGTSPFFGPLAEPESPSLSPLPTARPKGVLAPWYPSGQSTITPVNLRPLYSNGEMTCTTAKADKKPNKEFDVFIQTQLLGKKGQSGTITDDIVGLLQISAEKGPTAWVKNVAWKGDSIVDNFKYETRRGDSLKDVLQEVSLTIARLSLSDDDPDPWWVGVMAANTSIDDPAELAWGEEDAGSAHSHAEMLTLRVISDLVRHLGVTNPDHPYRVQAAEPLITKKSMCDEVCQSMYKSYLQWEKEWNRAVDALQSGIDLETLEPLPAVEHDPLPPVKEASDEGEVSIPSAELLGLLNAQRFSAAVVADVSLECACAHQLDTLKADAKKGLDAKIQTDVQTLKGLLTGISTSGQLDVVREKYAVDVVLVHTYDGASADIRAWSRSRPLELITADGSKVFARRVDLIDALECRPHHNVRTFCWSWSTRLVGITRSSSAWFLLRTSIPACGRGRGMRQQISSQPPRRSPFTLPVCTSRRYQTCLRRSRRNTQLRQTRRSLICTPGSLVTWRIRLTKGGDCSRPHRRRMRRRWISAPACRADCSRPILWSMLCRR